MPALLDCRPLAVAHDHSPIVDWRCSQWARQWQEVWRGCRTRGDSCSGSGRRRQGEVVVVVVVVGVADAG